VISGPEKLKKDAKIRTGMFFGNPGVGIESYKCSFPKNYCFSALYKTSLADFVAKKEQGERKRASKLWWPKTKQSGVQGNSIIMTTKRFYE